MKLLQASALLLAASLARAQESDDTTHGPLWGSTSPPKYPSPWIEGTGGWEESYRRAQEIVSQMTLVEKVNLTTGTGWQTEACIGQIGGVPRLGLDSLCLQVSSGGVILGDRNSVFTGAGTIGAAWDRDLWYERGFAVGTEHRLKGVDVLLGPVISPLGRSPAGGRNWEVFSPDPSLSGIAVAETIRGIQDAGVIACAKHYLANEQERLRQVPEAEQFGYNITAGLSANVDDATMHELYLWPFADAVRAGTGAVMCSHNQINNSYSCGNSYTMNYLLKGVLGFQGFVLSDWSALHSGVSSALAGLDMAMPGDIGFLTGTDGRSYWGTNMTVAVLNGTLPEWRLDDMATRIMAAYYQVGRDTNHVATNFNSWTKNTYGYKHVAAGMDYGVVNQHVDVREGHGDKIREASARSSVLLKNNGALPLTGREGFTAVFGSDAEDPPLGPNACPFRGCLSGTLAVGWGSGSADFSYLVSPLTAIQNEILGNKVGAISAVTHNWAYPEITVEAAQADVAIVFVNANSGEGILAVDDNWGDRNNLTLWDNGDALIETVSAVCNNTIVVLHTVGPVLVNSFYDNPNVTAIIWAGLPGEQSGNSIADILYGRITPGGKLPFTVGAAKEDYGNDLVYEPNNGNAAPQVDFEEGVFIDYRAFDKADIEPIYEFGFGLSYTTFDYSNLQIQKNESSEYVATSGMTEAAPVLSNHRTDNRADYMFPDMPRIPLYIYPYLTSTDLEESYNASDYGMPSSEWLPEGATEGSPQPRVPAGGAPGGNPQLWDILYTVTATITNSGELPGEEIVQLYVNLGGPNDPKVVLRNFDRLALEPGESKEFSATLTRRDLSNWDTTIQNWVITDYPKTVFVGASSRKLLLQDTLP
ncbi:glycoside hydrolase family 3 protein [Patellaria atrata CBS 101060]|uniref:beta-glucosidase n=1 Tax=Patellaria atrata CBS 101060 TaxID=1346257 RepID=A0A9P4VP02_9PEZI|nr:glycoside hydrolase family 3 protein [Patellaria atrata CBS 101060]